MLGKRIAKRQNELYVAPTQQHRRDLAGSGFIRKTLRFRAEPPAGRRRPTFHPLS